MSDEVDAWQRRFERERAARKEAERLLELKSLELYEANQGLSQKVLEQTAALREALEEARAGSQAKDRFLSSVSHEFRTPLNAIIGFSQILGFQQGLSEDVKGFIDKISISGNSLLALVDSMLDITKLESGRMDVTLSDFKLEELVLRLRAQIEPQAAQKQIALVMPSNSFLVRADLQLLTQALLNLLSNAVKFSPDNSVVTLTAVEQQGEQTFTVSDSGIGIAEASLEKLFQPFSQVHDTSQMMTKGTGLGLVITKRIVMQHNGSVTVQSEPDKGTTFTVQIPAPNSNP